MWKPLRDQFRTRPVGIALGALNNPYMIARCYGGTDKAAHGYMPYYAKHLGSLRMHKNVILEIGVGGYDKPSPGGSLRVWRDYFPRSVIAGLDIHEKSVNLGHRVKSFRGDQSLSTDLARVMSKLGRLDVVIDDGSHVGEHQIASFTYLFGHLRPGGWYIIEDLSTSYSHFWDGDIPAPKISGVGLTKDLIDSVQSRDITFDEHPEWGPPPPADYTGIQELHIYPGITFVRKATN